MPINIVYIHEESNTLLIRDTNSEEHSQQVAPYSLCLAEPLTVVFGEDIGNLASYHLEAEDVYVRNGQTFQENIESGVYSAYGNKDSYEIF